MTDNPPTEADRRERYATVIHDAMEPDLSLVDQEPGAQALFARAAEAAVALADAEQNRRFLTLLANLGIATHRLDRIRDAARLHRQQLIGSSELYAVIEADAPAVPVPPTTTTADSPSRRAGLRDEIAAALYERERPPRDPAWADAYPADREVFEAMADAVLPVLYREWPWLRAEAEDVAVPPPADRAAVLQGAVVALERHLENFFREWPEESQSSPWVHGWTDAMGELRRMAEEAAVTPPPALTEEGRLRAQVEVLTQGNERDRGLAKVGARCMREGHQGLIEQGQVVIEGWRFAMAVALGLDTEAPWEAIHERVKEQVAEAQQQPSRDCPACEAGIAHSEHCPTPESHNWGCGCPGDRLPLYSDRGVDTPGCDCGHNGMGMRWHDGGGCSWIKQLTDEGRRLLAEDNGDETQQQCPGVETVPNRCTCGCEGCTHHCGAHQPGRTRLGPDPRDPDWTSPEDATYDPAEAQQQPDTETPEVTHGCPPDGFGLTPCCGRTPSELPLTDRISSEAPVTCKGGDRG